MGNIIRGFDLDASSLKEKADKSRRDRDHKYSDDKERMFSGSCYAVYHDRQQATLLKAAEGNGAILPTASTASATASAAADIRNVTQAQAQALALVQPTNKKARKGD